MHWLLVDGPFIFCARPFKNRDTCFKALWKSGQDDQDEFSLPTGFGFPEDLLKGGARRLVTDAKFDRSGSKCFSPDEMKCQSGLSERQAEMALQRINGVVHNEVRDGLRRHVAGAAP